jgi:general stress protein 26
MMNQLPDWMYHAIEESFTCQFASTTARDVPVSLPVFLNHFDPDTGTLIISSPVAMKRVENVRQRPKVAILFSPVGTGPGEPKHVLLVQGLAEVDDTNLESGWKRYFAGWARRQPSTRASLARMEQAMPGYTQRAIIRVRPTRFLGWPEGNFQQLPLVLEVKQ